MHTIVYGAKTFILENPDSVKLMLQAKAAKERGDLAAADFIKDAVEAETGRVFCEAAGVTSTLIGPPRPVEECETAIAA
jgi:hypothetical protein